MKTKWSVSFLIFWKIGRERDEFLDSIADALEDESNDPLLFFFLEMVDPLADHDEEPFGSVKLLHRSLNEKWQLLPCVDVDDVQIVRGRKVSTRVMMGHARRRKISVYTSRDTMRILFTRFPLESAFGGAENQTMWLAEGLKNRGFDVSFLGSCPVLLECFRDAGFVATGSQIGPPPVSMATAASFVWRRKKMLQALIAAFETLPQLPDAVCMLSLSEKILCTDWLTKRGVRVIWIEHDRVGRWLRSNPWLGELKRLSHLVTTVCVSELSRRMYVDLGFDPDHVKPIPNGVDGDRLNVDVPRPTRQSQNLHIGCVARLSPEKGVDVLLEAIADFPEASLSIVGKGPQEGEIRRLISEDTERLGIGVPRISLQKNIENLGAFYRSIDVFVLPSVDHDPFGLVAAEAMMCGTATIVTDACGIAGYVQDGVDALVVSAASAASLRDAILSVKDPALRTSLGLQGKVHALDQFALNRMIEAYEVLLH